jgi:transcriptional regulator with XRE-family HTH domain
MAARKTLAVPNRLAELRSAADMTQGQLAHALGVDRSFVSRWESRESDIPDRHKPALAAALKTTPAALMGWTEAAA